MADYVVTVPMPLWDEWIDEGDLPGQEWSGDEYHFYLGGNPPNDWVKGDRIYIVAHGKLRGYSPLVYIEGYRNRFAFARHGGAVAVTIPERITGFRGFRRRWWKREDEVAFPNWRVP